METRLLPSRCHGECQWSGKLVALSNSLKSFCCQCCNYIFVLPEKLIPAMTILKKYFKENNHKTCFIMNIKWYNSSKICTYISDGSTFYVGISHWIGLQVQFWNNQLLSCGGPLFIVYFWPLQKRINFHLSWPHFTVNKVVHMFCFPNKQ